MKHLLALLLLVPSALLAQDNPSYDPDFDGDGCYSVVDILGLLPLFGTCELELEWQCGDSTLFDSYWYETVLIGNQCWFAENLRTTVYASGDSIPAGLTDLEWRLTTDGATAVYGEGSTFCDDYSPDIDACDEAQSLAAYGRLYNWYAVDDVRGLCPAGWHVPTDGEWTELEDYITSQGFDGTEGTALKSTEYWVGVVNGTDDFGFSALPSGYRYNGGGAVGGDGFYGSGGDGMLWSSSLDGDWAWCRHFYGSVIYRDSYDPEFAFAVRCLKDAE